VQTTLLGLAIAFIIALVAALVGPFFIDWSQFRPQFEAEASRVIGAPVRVGGALDARLLPTPSLRLHAVVVGGANDAGRIRADKLDVEFSLGALMRGEWRANELTVNGVALDLGLDQQGRIDWPASARNASLGALAIDRLNLTGRVALHDAASRSTLELDDIAFSGDVRSLAGSIRGNGNFRLSGTRYPFRVSSSQSSDGHGVRVHLTLEPGAHGMSADLDGLLKFDARTPSFDGAVILASTTTDAATAASVTPWRLVAKLKADPAKAKLEQLEASYGADESALKLAGVADVRFGATPLLQVLLSARQLDADKVLAKQSNATEPMQLVPSLRALLAALPQTPLPTRIDVNAERIMLGGRPVQDIDLTLSADAGAWSVDRLEARAPGATDVSIRGAMKPSDAAGSFNGTLKLDSSDPGTFAAWLMGRSEAASRHQKPLHVSGNVRFASDLVAIDGLQAEVDGGHIAGRITWTARASGGGSTFDAALTADRLDLDAAAAFARAIGIPQTEWPDQGQLSLEIAQAISSGQQLRPVVAKVGYGPKSITLEQLRIGQASGVTLDGAGAFNREDATGKLTLQATATAVSQIIDLISPLAPALAERFKAPAVKMPGAARLKLDLALASNASDHTRGNARARIDIDMPQLNGTVTLTAAPVVSAIRAIDFSALSDSTFAVETQLSSKHGPALLALLGLDRAVATGDGPAQLQGTISGKWQTPLPVKARLSAADLDAEMQGVISPSSKGPTDVTLTVRRANIAPLFGFNASDPLAQASNLSTHVTRTGDKLLFSVIDSVVAGSRLRGRIGLTLGDASSVDGELGMDTLNLAQAFGLLIGAAGGDDDGPISRGLLQGWRGRIGFQALHGVLPGGIELQPVSGVVKSDGQSVSINTIKGAIGGGEIKADLDARQSTGGLALNGVVRFDGVDGAALRYRGLAMPTGRASMRMTLSSQGRSASALAGALSGNGSLTLESARIAGLNPQVFDVATRASDSGKATDDDKLRQIVAPELSSGSLAVSSAQIPFTIRDGRLNVGATTLDANGARAVVSGGYDFVADQVDIRASLTSLAAGPAGGRPQIEVFAVGTPDALERSVDVAALSSWLAVRAIDRETRRLDSIERGQTPPSPPAIAMTPPANAAPPVQPAVPAPNAPVTESLPATEVPLPDSDPRRMISKPKDHAPKPAAAPQASDTMTGQAVAPLPPPIEVRPAPGARPAKPRAPMVLTPPLQGSQRPGL
jgi:large subunit ribosomal protein L24